VTASDGHCSAVHAVVLRRMVRLERAVHGVVRAVSTFVHLHDNLRFNKNASNFLRYHISEYLVVEGMVVRGAAIADATNRLHTVRICPWTCRGRHRCMSIRFTYTTTIINFISSLPF
jgi:hypothetical protein